MLKSGYDGDVTVWSPQGRIFQIEYAVEASKNGTAAVGLKSKTHVVLCALKGTEKTASSYKTKLFAIDAHIAVSVCGLIADARSLVKKMYSKSLAMGETQARQQPVRRLVVDMAVQMQRTTQEYGGRPHGLAMLVAGVDAAGTHIVEYNPRKICEYKAMAIGARSQAAKTYLEATVEQLAGLSCDELIGHGLRALQATLRADDGQAEQASQLTVHNCTVAVIDALDGYTELQEEQLQHHLARLEA